MLTPTPLPMPALRPGLRLELQLELELRPLVDQVRQIVMDQADDASAETILAAAPAVACQHLADLWHSAGPSGEVLRDQLSPEDQLVLDIVVNTFPPTPPPGTGSELHQLLDELALAPAE